MFTLITLSNPLFPIAVLFNGCISPQVSGSGHGCRRVRVDGVRRALRAPRSRRPTRIILATFGRRTRAVTKWSRLHPKSTSYLYHHLELQCQSQVSSVTRARAAVTQAGGPCRCADVSIKSLCEPVRKGSVWRVLYLFACHRRRNEHGRAEWGHTHRRGIRQGSGKVAGGQPRQKCTSDDSFPKGGALIRAESAHVAIRRPRIRC